MDHAVCVVDDLIFDARLPYALKLRQKGLDMVCGSKGLSHVGVVLRFCYPYGTNKRHWEREMMVNW
jgi:hypothetical protein